MKDKCPCLSCKIEREKDYTCRLSNCNSYLSWVNRMKKKNASEEPQRSAAAKPFQKEILNNTAPSKAISKK